MCKEFGKISLVVYCTAPHCQDEIDRLRYFTIPMIISASIGDANIPQKSMTRQ